MIRGGLGSLDFAVNIYKSYYDMLDIPTFVDQDEDMGTLKPYNGVVAFEVIS